VRGVTKSLTSNGADSEYTSSAGTDLVSFDSDGFTVGATNVWNSYNVSGGSLVAWQWKAGGAAVTNTAGSISAQVSANPTAGFSVVTYTGNASIASFGHGLGVAPKMIIIKNRTASGGNSNWCVGIDIAGWNWNTDYLYLNSTIAKATDGGGTQFYSAPTSTVVNIGGGTNTNGNTNSMVAYCWSEIDGFSKFGSYTGNGSADGPFVYTGFRPRFIMLKNTTTGNNAWHMIDTVRGTSNVYGPSLDANDAGAEITYTICDVLSNGFKLRDTNQAWNKASDTYIYAAFAENPFRNSLAR
jgi:hypothetical protein